MLGQIVDDVTARVSLSSLQIVTGSLTGRPAPKGKQLACQREDQQGMASCYRDVLLVANHEAHGAVSDHATERFSPQ